MSHSEWPVLIVGGGPVGVTLAADLGWRGIECLLVDAGDEVPNNPRCNTTAARSMEHFRRLGVADKIRDAGLPGDHETTVRYRTRFAGGHELRTLPLPSADQVRAGHGREDWPGPEPQHRIAQIYLEPILREHAQTFSSVSMKFNTKLVDLVQDEEGVTAYLENSDGDRSTVRARYVVGADGAHSSVRTALGIKLSGIGALGANYSLLVQSAELGRIQTEPAWSTVIFNPQNTSAMIAINGTDLWLSHHKFPVGFDTSDLDPAALLADAVGHPVGHEVVGSVEWIPRRLVAERFRDRRVFLAGDAAHLWIPMAGFGMNAGIQEATSLAWMLAAVLDGWADPAILDAYDRERRPVGEAVADAVAAVRIYELEVDDRIEESSETGEALRTEFAGRLAEGDHGQYLPDGLSFGINYEDSPVISYDDTAFTPLQISRYEPSTRPGCRITHLWMADGTSLFDHLGAGFTLIRTAPETDPVDWATQARERNVPLTVLDLPAEHAEAMEKSLVLVRPDQYVAWRGNDDPADIGALLDHVRGAANHKEEGR